MLLCRQTLTQNGNANTKEVSLDVDDFSLESSVGFSSLWGGINEFTSTPNGMSIPGPWVQACKQMAAREACSHLNSRSDLLHRLCIHCTSPAKVQLLSREASSCCALYDTACQPLAPRSYPVVSKLLVQPLVLLPPGEVFSFLTVQDNKHN